MPGHARRKHKGRRLQRRGGRVADILITNGILITMDPGAKGDRKRSRCHSGKPHLDVGRYSRSYAEDTTRQGDRRATHGRHAGADRRALPCRPRSDQNHGGGRLWDMDACGREEFTLKEQPRNSGMRKHCYPRSKDSNVGRPAVSPCSAAVLP